MGDYEGPRRFYDSSDIPAQMLQREYQWALENGVVDQWLAARKDDLAQFGGFFAPQPRPDYEVGGRLPGWRTQPVQGTTQQRNAQTAQQLYSPAGVGRVSYGGAQPNWAVLNSYYTNPTVRNAVQSAGAAPNYYGVNVTSGNGGQTYGRTGGANPVSQRGGMGSPFAGKGGSGGLYAMTVPQASRSQYPSSPGQAGGGGSPYPYADPTQPYGTTAQQLTGVGSALTDRLAGELRDPSGLDVASTWRAARSGYGQDAQRNEEAIRQSYARRGQADPNNPAFVNALQQARQQNRQSMETGRSQLAAANQQARLGSLRSAMPTAQSLISRGADVDQNNLRLALGLA